MDKKTKILFVPLLLLLFFPSTLKAQAILPNFFSYNIDNTAPDIRNRVAITVTLDFISDTGEDISSMVGPLTVLLLWSRDKSLWQSESMSLIAGNNIFRAIIPTQDGSDNQYYNEGVGPCYWYIEIKNTQSETDYLFSSSNPNTEIYFLDYSAGNTSIPDTSVPISPPNPIEEWVEEIFGEDPFSNPTVQFILLAIVAAVFVIIATSRFSGERINRYLRRFFIRR